MRNGGGRMKSNLKNIIKPYEPYKINFDELSKSNIFPSLMYDGEQCVPIKSLGLTYSDIIERHAEIVSDAFNNMDGVKITQEYNKKPVRLRINNENIHIVSDLLKFFSELTGAELTEVTITRNCVTEVPQLTNSNGFINSKDWYSSYWHTDNFVDGNFKIMIYLTDVLDEYSAPFEYIVNPNDYFYKQFNPNELSTRFYDLHPSDEETIKFYAPKYTTIIFSPSFIHKGNYARKNHRDTIMLGFNQGRKSI